jgi:hypothetical protein
VIRPNASKKDTLINVGTISSIGELTQSKTEGSPYYYEEIEIKAAGSGQDAKIRLMWAPDFFNPNFDTKSFTKSSEFVYAKNLAGAEGDTGYLEGLCGSAEVFAELDEQVKNLPDYEPETIHEFIKSFLNGLGPVQFIYVLKQERKKDGTVDANGKARYVRGKYYDVDSIQYLNEKVVKGLVRGVEANQKSRAKAEKDGKEPPVAVKFTFEPSDFGIDVEVPGQEPAWTA